VRIAMTAFAVTMSLNALVVLPLSFTDFANLHILVATNTCIGAAVNTWLLWSGLRREGVLRHVAGWPVFVMRVLVANAVMGVLLVWLAGDTARWSAMGFVERIARGGGGILLGAAVYFAVLFLSGMRYRHLRSVST
jgi:putative peptidoglycan lipid II flippase